MYALILHTNATVADLSLGDWQVCSTDRLGERLTSPMAAKQKGAGSLPTPFLVS